MQEPFNSFQKENLSLNLVAKSKKYWSYVKYTSGKTHYLQLCDSNDDARMTAVMKKNCSTQLSESPSQTKTKHIF